jgi:hypothetical protein
MRASTLLLLCSLSLFVPSLATAQQAAHGQEEAFGRPQRQRFYDQTKRSHARALGYSLLLPGLGNVYAEQPFTGAVLMSSFALSVLTLTFALLNDDPQLTIIGGVLTGGIYTTSIITSAYGVSDYNHRLYQRYDLARAQPARPALFVPLVSWSF